MTITTLQSLSAPSPRLAARPMMMALAMEAPLASADSTVASSLTSSNEQPHLQDPRRLKVDGSATPVSATPVSATLSAAEVNQRISDIIGGAEVTRTTTYPDLSTEDRNLYEGKLDQWKSGRIRPDFGPEETAWARKANPQDARAHLEARRAAAVQESIQFYENELRVTTKEEIDDATRDALNQVVLDVLAAAPPSAAVLTTSFTGLFHDEIRSIAKRYNTLAPPQDRIPLEDPKKYYGDEQRITAQYRYQGFVRDTLGGKNGAEAADCMKEAVVGFFTRNPSKIYDHVIWVVNDVTGARNDKTKIERGFKALCNHLLHSQDYRMADAPKGTDLMAFDRGEWTGCKVAASKEEYRFLLDRVYEKYQADCIPPYGFVATQKPEPTRLFEELFPAK